MNVDDEVMEMLRDELSAITIKLERAIKIKPRLLSQSEASIFLSLSESYLEKLRNTNDGPPYIKLKGFIRYDIRDLESWIDSRQRH